MASIVVDETKAWADALAKLIDPARVLTSLPDRLAYARDCWPRLTIRARANQLPEVLPRVIVQPKNEEEIASIVRWAEREGAPIVPYGAGSGVCGGAIPLKPCLTVDVKLIRHLEINKEDMTIRVGPGVIGEHLERDLGRVGLTMGHYPSSLYCSSVGGYLAGRSAGQYSSRFGKIEDMVDGLRVVTGAGALVDTHKDPALTQLFVGSEGTLGIITDATMRVCPAPESLWYRGFLVPTVEAGTRAMQTLMQSGFRPAVVRLYDEIDTLFSKGFRPGHKPSESGLFSKLMASAKSVFQDSVGGDEVRSIVDRTSNSLMGRMLGQPLLVQKMASWMPGGCLLVVGFEGPAPEVVVESSAALGLLQRFGEDLGSYPGEHWYENRFKVSYKLSPLMETGAFTDTMEVSTRWSHLSQLYAAVRKAMGDKVVVMAHFSHAYTDSCSIYFTFAGFAESQDELLAKYDAAWKSGLDAVASVGASVAHHHGVGFSKAKYVPYDHQGGRPLFDALKQAYDPNAVFNPGKVWLGGTT